MKDVKVLIEERGFEKLRVLMEEWYLTECIVNNSSEVDAVNIINKPTVLERIKNLIYFCKNNIKEHEVDFLELSLKELGRKKDIGYSYILSENNQVSNVVEHKLSYEQMEQFQNRENEYALEM